MFELLKAALKTGSSAIATIVFRVISIKILAMALGPAGMGLFSLLRQSRDTLQPLASFGSGTAIVQGVASNEGKKKQEYIVTVALLLGANLLLFTFFVLFFSPWLGALIFGDYFDENIRRLMPWVMLPVGLGVLAGLTRGILNGYRAIGRLAVVQVAGVVALALFSYPLARLAALGNSAAFLLLIVVVPTVTLLTSLVFLWRGGWVQINHPRFRFWAARHFLWISIPTLIAGFGRNGMLLSVRTMITRFAGLGAAGYFDVAWAFSLLYVNLITSSFGTYYLPTLSATREPVARLRLIRQVLRFVMLGVVPLIVGLVVLKPWIITVFYSREFLPAINLMQWMLIADYFKVTSWVFGITLLADADMKTFLWTELLFFAIFAGGVWLATEQGKSLNGVGIAFLVMYIGYFIFMGGYAYRRQGFVPSPVTVLQWLGGLGLIVLAAAFTWSQTTVNWSLSMALLLVSLGYSALIVEKREYYRIWQVVLNPRSLLL